MAVNHTVPTAKAVELLERQIDAGQKLRAHDFIYLHAFDAWLTTTQNYLIKAFGEDSPNVTSFEDVGRIWSAPGNADDAWWSRAYRDQLEAKLARLGSYVEVLRTEAELQTLSTAPSPATLRKVSKQVFIVHGHNEAVRETCARFLEKLELKPIILHEKPNAGRTIIEKFQDYSEVGFAVVLLTGDDKGGTKNCDLSALRPRARQNVIFELGFFIGKIGRTKVCALYEPGVELPSDYSGILFIELDAAGAWKFQLGRELKAGGVEVDLNKAI